MTELDMIREGFGVWIESSFGSGFEFEPVLFILFLLFGFLATGLLETIRIALSIIHTVTISFSAEGREIIDDANTARLFELVSQLGDAGQDGLGLFRQGYLEQSSVDLIREITELIEAQRGYELNAKVITAADQMLGATTQIR